MTVSNIRFRVEGDFVVLQVQVPKASASVGCYTSDPSEWRDAKVTDLLGVARFTRDPSVGPYTVIGADLGHDRAQFVGAPQRWSPP